MAEIEKNPKISKTKLGKKATVQVRHGVKAMSIKEIKAEELRQKGGAEGIVFQGCGGDAKDWVDGVNQLLKDEKILDVSTIY